VAHSVQGYSQGYTVLPCGLVNTCVRQHCKQSVTHNKLERTTWSHLISNLTQLEQYYFHTSSGPVQSLHWSQGSHRIAGVRPLHCRLRNYNLRRGVLCKGAKQANLHMQAGSSIAACPLAAQSPTALQVPCSAILPPQPPPQGLARCPVVQTQRQEQSIQWCC
jgi:hypothetical protein